MSSPSAEQSPAPDRCPDLLEPVLEGTRAAGFWGAIALPALYVPLAVVGVDGQQKAVILLALLVANLIAVLLGRGYDVD